MVSRSWSELPELTEGTYCGPDMPGFGSRMPQDDFVLITHSLGSRATIDAMQRLTNMPVTSDPRIKRVADQFAQRDIQVFMLSNQLPLLEAGREGQQVTGQIGSLLRAGRRPSRGASSTRPRSSPFPTPTT